jgi:hypothetical protein
MRSWVLPLALLKKKTPKITLQISILETYTKRTAQDLSASFSSTGCHLEFLLIISKGCNLKLDCFFPDHQLGRQGLDKIFQMIHGSTISFYIQEKI